MYISASVVLAILIVIPTSNVFAGGPRLDYPEDANEEGADCWVDGYDAGFAGKYDSDRAKECLENGDDNYNSSWGYACKDAGYMPDECEGFKNNPVDIQDHEALVQENKRPAETGTSAGMGDPRPQFSCFKEQDPEKYCLNTDDPVFCKTIGDICDADGFVRPEYPYCKSD